MKAQIMFNEIDHEAKDRAELMGLSEPEPKTIIKDFYFKLKWIEIAYLNSDGDMVIFLSSVSWVLEFDQDVWDKIISYLDKEAR